MGKIFKRAHPELRIPYKAAFLVKKTGYSVDALAPACDPRRKVESMKLASLYYNTQQV